MFKKSAAAFIAGLALIICCHAQARAQQTPAAGPAAYDTFIKGATVQSGLIPIIHKAGKVYLALTQAQIGKDFIQTAVPSTGLGGFGFAAGEPYVAPARILHFDKSDDKIVVRWPNTYAKVQTGSPAALASQANLPASIIAVEPIVAKDAANGTVVISAAFFLGDLADAEAGINQSIVNPAHWYHLDPSRSLFATTKVFPENDVLHVTQTWATSSPDTIDNAPDARSIEVGMTYNIIAAPDDGYMPRVADPRVGYFQQPLLNFASDQEQTRNIYYILRWNFGKITNGTPSHPIVYYIGNDVPVAYRGPVKRALLAWNAAFARLGIRNAVSVEQQPNDPNWDVEDIRHNMIRWIDTSNPIFGAEALIIGDPRTGEELNIGVNVDAIEGLARNQFRFEVAPARNLPDTPAAEKQFTSDYITGVVLHESGHDFGLQHNFIGSMAYTAKELQSKTFTQRYGVASSVMEYSPLNLWPAGTPQGDYAQTALGPYDYYAITYGYGSIPNARTPQQERSTLNRWASDWTNPRHRFASDEDTSYGNGHAIDPRVNTFDLTNHPLQWCNVQMRMMHGLMDRVNARFPSSGQTYDEARRAFLMPLRTYTRCASFPAHWIGGEYLSRSRKGDPHAEPPLMAVSRGDEYHAWSLLANGMFSDGAWHFNPNVLTKLVYSEWAPLTVSATWAYNPGGRHDIPVVQIAAQAQDNVLAELFAPLTLQRIDDLSTKYTRRKTMSLSDLFDWTRSGIFGDIGTGAVDRAGVVRRNLQVRFAKLLAKMWTSPEKATPGDAQALARLQLVDLRDSAQAASRRGVSEITRAHLAALSAIATQALEARATIAP